MLCASAVWCVGARCCELRVECCWDGAERGTRRREAGDEQNHTDLLVANPISHGRHARVERRPITAERLHHLDADEQQAQLIRGRTQLHDH